MSCKNLLIISIHSGTERLNQALATAYADSAAAASHNIRCLQLDQLSFNPLLQGYQNAPALEPDLQAAQADILWAEHITLIYPIWWGSVPALLKGFFDRVLLPGFAYKYQSGKKYPQPLLLGRTAHLLLTMDTPPWYYRWVDGAPGLRQVSRTTLGFCGIKTVKSLLLGPVISSTLAQRQRWLQQAGQLAQRL
ncbi:hypothetical protein WG68_11925 [Arsukibacterium ikkense]|uniref:Flavodoxin-like fold domain-containing protein n=1 Tax=Arsukibacterium ikkense TaxID=336831 RepID=A0A0M2V665_9GAMM|nr:NAD(P)H-dependent oxidoreductase [Arsukibacterium ikkense]KKO45130.1 hypothetical protein WG68_11925 [Arsukibacterium ikkense]